MDSQEESECRAYWQRIDAEIAEYRQRCSDYWKQADVEIMPVQLS